MPRFYDAHAEILLITITVIIYWISCDITGHRTQDNVKNCSRPNICHDLNNYTQSASASLILVHFLSFIPFL